MKIVVEIEHLPTQRIWLWMDTGEAIETITPEEWEKVKTSVEDEVKSIVKGISNKEVYVLRTLEKTFLSQQVLENCVFTVKEIEERHV